MFLLHPGFAFENLANFHHCVLHLASVVHIFIYMRYNRCRPFLFYLLFGTSYRGAIQTDTFSEMREKKFKIMRNPHLYHIFRYIARALLLNWSWCDWSRYNIFFRFFLGRFSTSFAKLIAKWIRFTYFAWFFFKIAISFVSIRHHSAIESEL